MAKKKKYNLRSLKPRAKLSKVQLLWRSGAGLLLLAAVVLAAAYITYSFWHQHREAGQFGVSDTFVGEDLSDSLDLKLAAKATYPSAPIKLTQDLGTSNGLQKQIFSFAVKNDNLTEFGLMVAPASAPPAGGFPTIILLHGFANPSRYSTTNAYISDMEFYASHGFAVFKPDYRGQGLSVDHGLPNSAYFSMDYNDDVMSLISALSQTSFVDKANINIWGHSLGAYIGLRAAVLSANIKNLILLSGPVDSLKEMYLTYVPPSDELNPYALATRNDVFAKYGIPTDNTQFWFDASPINFVSKLKAHVQIHVGLQDKVVPPKFSADLKAALANAHISYQYFEYPDGIHSLLDQRDQIWARTLQLLQPHQAPSA